MKKCVWISALVLLSLFQASWVAAQEADAEGCKDHPMFSRMKDFYISSCESKFDAAEFYLADDKTQTVEGQKTKIDYALKEGGAEPSYLQIRRNYTNAVKSIGGQILLDQERHASFKIVKGGKEVWASVEGFNDGRDYTLIVLEKGEMTQEVTAKDMLDALNKDGFIALYINFDTGKFDIKPDSQPIIDQIAALLKNNPDLKLGIEGHTDNVGTAEGNKKLSEQRAKSVMNAVVKLGIAADRLSATGWGQEKPVADNRTEDGRAKNRRVEIVKK
jgi:outer membrane protein OmpA-like peptidoglycan-associated protein